MNNISIFKRRELEKIYEIKNESLCTDGIHLRNFMFFKDIKKECPILSEIEIGRYIGIPALDPGEELYLTDKKETITIKKRVQGSDGSIIYYVEDAYVETENTKKSEVECDRFIEANLSYKSKYKQLEKDFNEYKEKYKYKNQFFNFRSDDIGW